MGTDVTKEVERDKACPLLPWERDRYLVGEDWRDAEHLRGRWLPSENGDYLSRLLLFENSPAGKSDGIEIAHESILRFPNAPVYGTHQPRSHTYEIEDHWPNYHTMRVLTRPALSTSGVKQVFLLHNGLNETKDIGFHYRLASWILAECEDAACIIRPLPGHLSRYPFQSPFTGLPLDDYLLDPALVFRQFLRYMLETQWLLSAIVPRNDYRVATGCDLLLYKADPGRESNAALAEEIAVQANRALAASSKVGNHNTEKLMATEVERCVDALRGLLGWSPIDQQPPRANEPDLPTVHAVGYSMGGFIAQSIFCTWPYAVASCSNLFAGGALRDLAPTAFAHPEEWQSVLHGLRSELDQARVDRRFDRSRIVDAGRSPTVGTQMVGIERGTFEYFSHIFDDVFLQVNAGAYSTRLAEFSRRLLFILGGDDPIVRTRKVLDAAPPGGVTMHQIGDLSHFPSKRVSERAEKEQREFWLPEAGKMIGRFATRAETLLQQTNSRGWLDEKGQRAVGDAAESGAVAPVRRADGALTNLLFEHELDEVVSMLDGGQEAGGWLFISRNQIPTAFLEESAYRAYGAAMHHAEDQIGDYMQSIGARAKKLDKARERISMLIPSDQLATTSAFDWIHDRARFSKSESAMRVSLNPQASGEGVEDFAKTLMDNFAKKWCGDGVVRVVKANEYAVDDLNPIGSVWSKQLNDKFPLISLTMLPDMWMAFSKAACLDLLKAAPNRGREAIEAGMVNLACELAADRKVSPSLGNDASKLYRLRREGEIRTVEVSGAELNPRYRGRVLDDAGDDTTRLVTQLIIHWAIARVASTKYRPRAERTGEQGL